MLPALFSFVFLAAVVGLFKPYIKGSKRSYFGIAAVVAFVCIGITAAPPPRNGRAGAAAAATTSQSTGPEDSSTTAQASSQATDSTSTWEYTNHKDEMRGTSSKLAQTKSENTVDLAEPYGEVHGAIWVRQRPEDGLNAAFEVENGQILCNSFMSSYVSVKFDSGPVEKFSCTDASDGSNNVAFIENAHRFLAELKKSKRTIVEAEFFEQGRKQFSFRTAGLNWK